MPQQYSFLSIAEIVTLAISEAINNSSSQLTAIQDPQMIIFIKSLDDKFRRAAHVKHDAGGWSWLVGKDFPFQTYRGTTLSAPIDIGAASLPLVSGTNFPSSGRLAIQTVKGSIDIIDFMSNVGNVATVNTASGSRTVQIAHAAGEKVMQLYPIPSDMAKMEAFKVNSYPPFEQSNSFAFPVFGEYRQIDGYFMVPYNLPESDVTIWYESVGNVIQTTGDAATTAQLTNIPKEALRWAVEETLFHLFRIRRKREDLAVTQRLMDDLLQEFLTYDALLSSETLMRYQ